MNPTAPQSERGFFRRNRWRIVLAVLAASAVAAFAWAYYDSRYPSWYEEVRLSDGRVITIHRKHQYFENYGINQSWVEIDLPELGGKQVWHSYLIPQRVDVVNGKVYLFGIPRGPRQLSFYRYPKHYMVAFEWRGDGFERIPFLQVPELVRQEENIYSCVPKKIPEKLLLTAKMKAWCPPRGDNQELGKKLDLSTYSKAADAMAALSDWTNRSN